jgi:hypothetical protein
VVQSFRCVSTLIANMLVTFGIVQDARRFAASGQTVYLYRFDHPGSRSLFYPPRSLDAIYAYMPEYKWRVLKKNADVPLGADVAGRGVTLEEAGRFGWLEQPDVPLRA